MSCLASSFGLRWPGLPAWRPPSVCGGLGFLLGALLRSAVAWVSCLASSLGLRWFGCPAWRPPSGCGGLSVLLGVLLGLLLRPQYSCGRPRPACPGRHPGCRASMSPRAGPLRFACQSGDVFVKHKALHATPCGTACALKCGRVLTMIGRGD